MSDELLDSGENSGKLELSGNAINDLNSISKWAQFLSILGFIGIGFMVIGALFALMAGNSSSFGRFNGGMNFTFLGILYLVMAVIYFFPVYYLFKFAMNMKNAVATNGSNDMNTAFSYLKAHYKFIGIFTIVILSIYLLMFLFSMIMMAAR